jgi:ribosome-associated protein
MEKIEFELTQEYIELIKLLKLLNLCESGSEAKLVVDEGLVKFNNVVEFQRRKKLRKNDVVLFQNTEIRII